MLIPNNNIFRQLKYLVSAPVSAVFLTAFLAACGGGGGSSSPPPSAPIQVGGSSSVIYSASSEENAAFSLLNAERTRCGYAPFAQHLQLDAAAKAHADYQIINGLVDHREDQLNFPRGFTGTSPIDRIVAQGYIGAGAVTDEIVAWFGSTNKVGTGSDGIRGLLSAPYHLRGLLDGYRDVGIAIRSSTDLGVSSPSVYLQINAAYKSTDGPQLIANDAINTYPCQGSTGINRQLSNETPNPVPGRDLSTQPLGAVVYVSVRQGNTLIINSSQMVQTDNNQSIQLRAPVTSSNDPYGGCSSGCFMGHEAYFAADAPMLANTNYSVLINGSNNGRPFSRSFSFTTGTGG